MSAVIRTLEDAIAFHAAAAEAEITDAQARAFAAELAVLPVEQVKRILRSAWERVEAQRTRARQRHDERDRRKAQR